MSTLLVIRDTCKEYYRKFEWIINPILKFIAAFMVFSLINKEIGYDSRLLKNIIVVALAAVCTGAPASLMVFFAAVMCLIHIFAASFYPFIP